MTLHDTTPDAPTTDGDEYRIDYTIQRRRPGDEDFTDIGFGSSGSWSTLNQCSHMVDSDVQNQQWETEGDMPDPDTINPGFYRP